MKVGWVEIVNIIIIFQLIVFAFFLFVKKTGSISNYFLGIHLFSQAAAIFNSLTFIQKDFFYNNNPHLCLIGYPFVFLWGPTFYLYIKSIVNKDFKFEKKHLLHFVPFLLFVVLFSITFYFYGLETKRTILNDPTYFYFSQYRLIDLLLRLQILFYIVKSIKILYSVRKGLKENYSSVIKSNLGWLNFIVIGYTVCYLISVSFVYTEFNLKDYDRILLLGNILQFFIYFNIIFFQAWMHPEIFKYLEETTKYKNSKLTKEEANLWINKVNEFVRIKRPYLNPDLTLNQFAEELAIPSRFLSQIINEYFKQTFFDYINRLRVEEAKKMLLDPSASKNVTEILYETGFNSKATFNRVFKKETGLSPTEYKKKSVKPGILEDS